MGLHRAGFDVEGVDIRPQPNYPFQFHLADALTFDLSGFDFIWASPPCQRYTQGLSNTKSSLRDSKPDYVAPIRERLKASGLPYIIENVEGAPLINPVLLCGESFGLRVLRHRLFESNLLLFAPAHPRHRGTLYGGEYVAVYHGKWKSSGSRYPIPQENTRAAAWRDAMGIPWMTKKELAEAIPPAYSEYLGQQVHPQLERAAELAA